MRKMMTFFLVAATFAFTVIPGCLPKPDGCTPGTTRCSPSGEPQTCSPGERWTTRLGLVPCAEMADAGNVCCLTRGVYTGNPIHSCVPQVACLPAPVAVDASVAEVGHD